jgi:hypothetical protein
MSRKFRFLWVILVKLAKRLSCELSVHTDSSPPRSFLIHPCRILASLIFPKKHDHRYYAPRNAAYGHQTMFDGIIKDGLWDVYNQFQ